MNRYIHLARYGKPGDGADVEVLGDGVVWARGRRWNLRTGEKSGFVPGFFHSVDGRYVQYGDTHNEIVHPDGRVVPIGPKAAFPQGGQFVGSYFVAGDTYGTKPKLVIDESGKEAGRLVQTAKNPGIFNPYDGETLWLNEDKFLAQHDVGARKVVRKIDAPKGTAFAGLAVTRTGHLATWERGKQERLVAFDANNKRVGEQAQAGMSIAPLADGFVVSDHTTKQFVVLDTALQVLERIPMFMPGRDGHNSVIGLPSGREWIAVGGRGEWDHYGEPALAPKGGGAAKLAATAKAPAKAKPAAEVKPVAKAKSAPKAKAAAKAKPKTKSPAVKPAKKSAKKK